MTVSHLREFGAGDVDRAGGKGANLGELIRNGFPIPPGFVVCADEYAKAVESLPPDLAPDQICDALEAWQDEATAIQDQYRAEVNDYRAEADVYQAEVVAYQTELADWQVARASAVQPAEALVDQIHRDMGWTFVNKKNTPAYIAKVAGTWIAQGVIISILFVAILILQKRKDSTT